MIKIHIFARDLMVAKVILTIIEGNLKGKKFEFDSRATCLVGRAQDCQIQFPNDEDNSTISRYHCFLDINPPYIQIRDLGSRHGTHINEKLIGKRLEDQTPEQGTKLKLPEQELKNGDRIRLSNTVFHVDVDSETILIPIENDRSFPNVKLELGKDGLIQIQGYTTLKFLGGGGFGKVYLARHNQTGNLVALKTLKPEIETDPNNKERFLREIRNSKILNHPNVVQTLDCGYDFDNQMFFLVMEYCQGGSLSGLLRHKGGKLSIQEALSVTLQILQGLEYTHNVEISLKTIDGSIALGKGLVHRDIKPENIFVSITENDQIQVKLGDYGLSKAFWGAGFSGLIKSDDIIIGTPEFMSRKQAINFKYALPEVDVWATAATLYHMLTGQYPRNFSRDYLNSILQSRSIPIRQRDASIPEPLAEVIDRALVDNPEIVVKSAKEFQQALLPAIDRSNLSCWQN